MAVQNHQSWKSYCTKFLPLNWIARETRVLNSKQNRKKLDGIEIEKNEKANSKEKRKSQQIAFKKKRNWKQLRKTREKESAKVVYY